MTDMTLAELRNADTFSSTDVIERVKELRDREDDEDGADPLTDEEREELATLERFANEASGYAADWDYGETFIRDSYFVEYAQELADDIGAVDNEAGWPATYIDWDRAAEALQMDYSAVDLDGVTFWTR